VFSVNTAPACVAALTFTVQVPPVAVTVPVAAQAPLQPLKVEVLPLAAVSVTLVPEATVLLQVVGQLMPDGFDVSVPWPEPVTVVVSAKLLAGIAVKVAATVRAADIVTTQVLVPVQPAPLQPVNE
jgi:hypothetical protein